MVASGSGDKTIKLWDTKTGLERQTLNGHTSWVGSVAFSPDGQTVASGSGDKTIKLWDAKTGLERRTLEGHSDSVEYMASSDKCKGDDCIPTSHTRVPQISLLFSY
ncbi:WD40 repeat domain-containing protein [Aspergillus tanneri]|uniref:Mitochondrial division protein 1 n=1 Tax=Aspergillus tanneri TaxID=1220188 RepID=A0A5M9MFT4_9EURO|nr:uncharacterized protein ATNIH1004_007253 [Aspergillus tanneri]KAA8645832.1 hypothetical protein ATNIH1004_007253 [Aspergillus tanneri]